MPHGESSRQQAPEPVKIRGKWSLLVFVVEMLRIVALLRGAGAPQWFA